MWTYCLNCKKDTGSVNWNMLKNKNGRTVLLQNVLYVVVKNQNL